MRAVVNATPLIALAILGRLDLLRVLFDEVVVPAAVYDEVAVEGAGLPGAEELVRATWIGRVEPSASPSIEPLLLGLDPGELQVLLFGRELNAEWVVIDERLGRRVAKAMRLRVKGSAGLLLAGFRAGLLTRQDVVEAIDRLLANGIRMGSSVTSWLVAEMDTPISEEGDTAPNSPSE